jgi:hypothetical protein
MAIDPYFRKRAVNESLAADIVFPLREFAGDESDESGALSRSKAVRAMSRKFGWHRGHNRPIVVGRFFIPKIREESLCLIFKGYGRTRSR